MPHAEDHELLVRIDERVGRLEKELLGNGQPGAIGRIGALERWRSKMTGAFGVLVGLLTIAGGAVIAVVLQR